MRTLLRKGPGCGDNKYTVTEIHRFPNPKPAPCFGLLWRSQFGGASHDNPSLPSFLPSALPSLPLLSLFVITNSSSSAQKQEVDALKCRGGRDAWHAGYSYTCEATGDIRRRIHLLDTDIAGLARRRVRLCERRR